VLRSNSVSSAKTPEAGGEDLSLAMVRAGMAYVFVQYAFRSDMLDLASRRGVGPACGVIVQRVRGMFRTFLGVCGQQGGGQLPMKTVC
jgi:hypothetical protein